MQVNKQIKIIILIKNIIIKNNNKNRKKLNKLNNQI